MAPPGPITLEPFTGPGPGPSPPHHRTSDANTLEFDLKAGVKKWFESDGVEIPAGLTKLFEAQKIAE